MFIGSKKLCYVASVSSVFVPSHLVPLYLFSSACDRMRTVNSAVEHRLRRLKWMQKEAFKLAAIDMREIDESTFHNFNSLLWRSALNMHKLSNADTQHTAVDMCLWLSADLLRGQVISLIASPVEYGTQWNHLVQCTTQSTSQFIWLTSLLHGVYQGCNSTCSHS